jgi:hypothetical protein
MIERFEGISFDAVQFIRDLLDNNQKLLLTQKTRRIDEANTVGYAIPAHYCRRS